MYNESGVFLAAFVSVSMIQGGLAFESTICILPTVHTIPPDSTKELWLKKPTLKLKLLYTINFSVFIHMQQCVLLQKHGVLSTEKKMILVFCCHNSII